MDARLTLRTIYRDAILYTPFSMNFGSNQGPGIVPCQKRTDAPWGDNEAISEFHAKIEVV